MEPSIKLSVTNPCHEKWNSMSSTEKGAHCAVCSIQVVDFSQMSDIELIGYFKENDRSKAPKCGRFTHSQLDRFIPSDKKVSWINWKRTAAALLMFTLPAFAFTKKLFGQTENQAKTQPKTYTGTNSTAYKKRFFNGASSKAYHGNAVVYGYITDSKTGKPIVNEAVYLYKNKKIIRKAKTNDSGLFEFSREELVVDEYANYGITYGGFTNQQYVYTISKIKLQHKAPPFNASVSIETVIEDMDQWVLGEPDIQHK